ncbi:hypothetical protein BT63DRAFT_55234 [Microthyrium microscopicum]|uniref:Enhancer of polycomb-like protein n=1 Tax=Microthyrium microscopicum TaxID=703497 RepID=A0A6A6U2E3_9PEZI|nr:hypothetical protein BT63DRAFT_55234 [Microthyrium microscopicum]
MASQRAAGARFRQRKLSVKQNLSILREDEVEATFDDEAQRNIPKVETGVEGHEEMEHHLQAVISSHAAGNGKAAYIPTPPTNVSSVHYDRLYAPRYQHPQTYIRFSSTVEDSTGSPYCMTQEDELFLATLNASYKKASAKLPGPCTELQFEEVMSFFEENSSIKQPYATLDNTPVLPYSEMEQSFDDTIDPSSRLFAKDIYDHWKQCRLAKGNHPLGSALKFERNADTDEADPYVCFRRREVRQARKTRGRDAQITEKLKKMRAELEQARQLMHLTKQREHGRRDQLAIDRLIFEQRCAVKETKRNLGIKGNDQDLVNQKPVEKPAKPDPTMVRMPGMPPKMHIRPDARLQDHDLVLLSDERKKRESEVETVIQDSMAKHRTWNNDWVDNTWRPITPPLDTNSNSSFRAAITEYLPTPPASATSEQSAEGAAVDGQSTHTKPKEKAFIPFRYDSPPMETPVARPSFRRRMGRGGRMWIDRRGLARTPNMNEDVEMSDACVAERYQYDQDSDDEREVYHTDPYDNGNLRYRINYSQPQPDQAERQRRALLESQKRQQQAANSHLPAHVVAQQQQQVQRALTAAK